MLLLQALHRPVPLLPQQPPRLLGCVLSCKAAPCCVSSPRTSRLPFLHHVLTINGRRWMHATAQRCMHRCHAEPRSNMCMSQEGIIGNRSPAVQSPAVQSPSSPAASPPAGGTSPVIASPSPNNPARPNIIGGGGASVRLPSACTAGISMGRAALYSPLYATLLMRHMERKTCRGGMNTCMRRRADAVCGPPAHA